jgi:uncharacterized membrane protein
MTSTPEIASRPNSHGAENAEPPIVVRAQQPAVTLFALGLIGLGILALIYQDFALVWQPVAPWVPGRTTLALGSGILMLCGGIGLLFRATVTWTVRVLLPYFIVWALLKVPALVVAPQIEGVWLGFGELAMLLAGGWMLFARLAELREDSPLAFAVGDRGVRIARYVFAIWVIPVGLSHFFYVKETVHLIPSWIPFPIAWAYITGAGHIACGVALFFSVLPRAAATAEACMIGIFALVVWGPAVAGNPRERLPWTAFFISWVIAAAALAVAQNVDTHKAVLRDGPDI